MIPFTRTDLHCDVGYSQVGSRESLTLTIDCAPLLTQGDMIGQPVAYLTDRATGGDLSNGRVGTLVTRGSAVSIPLNGFIKGTQYRLTLTFAPAAGIVREVLWDLDCVA